MMQNYVYERSAGVNGPDRTSWQFTPGTASRPFDTTVQLLFWQELTSVHCQQGRFIDMLEES
jgi:hypothetical protein